MRANGVFARKWRYFLRQKTLGLLFVLTAAVLFGINGSLSRLLFDSGVTPVTLVEIRMIVGSLCLFALLSTQPRQVWRIPRRTWGWLVAFGLCIALVTYTYFVAISRVPIALVLVIQFTGPVWMATAVALWRRRLPSWHVFLALLLALSGVVLVTGLLEQRLGSLDVIGLLFSFFALISFIAYLVLGRKVGGHLHPIASTAYGAGVAAVFWLLVQPPWSIPASTWNLHTFILMVFVGIIGMAIPFSLEVAALASPGCHAGWYCRHVRVTGLRTHRFPLAGPEPGPLADSRLHAGAGRYYACAAGETGQTEYVRAVWRTAAI